MALGDIDFGELMLAGKVAARENYLRNFVAESNLIEGIQGEPTALALKAHRAFLKLRQVQVDDMVEFVRVIQPGAELRAHAGMNVVLGSGGKVVYRPPRGGNHMLMSLDMILQELQADVALTSPFEIHRMFESLHPFTDGNGRAGRVLWLWHMQSLYGELPRLGFLHSFYYQALQYTRK